MKGTFDQIFLRLGNRADRGFTPVFQRVGIFSYRTFTRARRVDEHRIKLLRQPAAKNAAIKITQRRIAHAAALDIGVQYFYSAGGKFIGD